MAHNHSDPKNIKPTRPMNLHNYLLFAFASLVLNLVPGPDMLFLLGRSVAQGKKAGLCAAFGINLGAYVHLAGATTGLSAILLASANAFLLVKWIGAAYLVYLGLRALASRGGAFSIDGSGAGDRSGRAIFWQGFLSDVLNPKVALFFLALLPQFVSGRGGDAVWQLLTLGVTGNVIGITVSVALVLISTSLSTGLRRNQRAAQWLHKAMGMLFIALGLRLVAERR
jgi:threonine/homoserine/homoserine lactone efflux protein